MNTLTIECRQKEANLVNQNGDYEVIIPNKIQIEEGDAIVVRNSFIDTEATESQKLVIPDEGLKLTIKSLKYLVDWDATDKQDIGGGAHTADGELYSYCGLVASPSDIKEVISLTIEYSGPTGGGGDVNWGDGTITLEYTNIEGNPDKFVINVDALDYPGFDQQRFDLAVYYDSSKPFKIVPDLLGGAFTQIDTPETKDVTDDLFSVDVETQEIEIEGGNYDPEDLVVVMNRELQANNPTGGALVDSPILTSTESAGVSTYKFVNFTSNKAFETNNKSYWVGSSDFEFSYIPNSKQFSVNRIHMPYYDTGNEAVGFIPFSGTDKLVTKNSGIMFFDLQAELRTSGTPFPFWTKTLGFNLNRASPECILAGYNAVDSNIDGAPVRIPRFTRFTDGINMTSGFSGLNAVVIKNGTDPFNYPPSAIPATGIFSTSTDVTPIIGKASSLNAQDSFGYFLVEVKAGFGNDFYTPLNNQSSVRAIVSRYYSVNSYTSGTEADSIVYRHNGDPMMLSSFKIRILDSLKNVASNIGEDNTIFIGIIKADKKTLEPK
jgi:hypothetical protein